MASSPLVSIVIPAYNQAEYLDAAIESVLAQDYPRLECIVIDDGSSDDTLAVARRSEQRHPGRLTVLTQPNAGQSAALNRGWELARGDVIGYLSSDDLLCPGAIGEIVAALERHPEASTAYCDYWLIDAQGKRLRVHQSAEFSLAVMRVDLAQPPGPGALFRRAVFDRAGGWNTSLRQVPDFEYWLRATDHGPFVRVPKVLAEFRIHEGSSSFRAMSPERADEIVGVMRVYWDKHAAGGDDAARSLSNALSMAAKNHAQSGRVFAALGRFARAAALRPALVLESGVWRRLLSGFTRRAYYGMRARLGRRA